MEADELSVGYSTVGFVETTKFINFPFDVEQKKKPKKKKPIKCVVLQKMTFFLSSSTQRCYINNNNESQHPLWAHIFSIYLMFYDNQKISQQQKIKKKHNFFLRK